MPTPSSTSQVWLATDADIALATWRVLDPILDEHGNSAPAPGLTWAFNAQASSDANWPDDSGWVPAAGYTFDGSVPESPVAPTTMQAGIFVQAPGPGGEPQFRAADGELHPAYIQLNGETIGYEVHLPPIGDALSISDVYLEVTYSGPRPGVSMETTGTDNSVSTSWSGEARTDFQSGDTVIWKMLSDTGTVAQWRMRRATEPVFNDVGLANYYASWPNVYYGNLNIPGGFDHLFVRPWTSTDFGDPEPSPSIVVHRVRIWREYVASTDPDPDPDPDPEPDPTVTKLKLLARQASSAFSYD